MNLLRFGLLAQLVERLLDMQEVAGSSPARPTIYLGFDTSVIDQ
jgi:hypothetical protein